MLGTVATLAPGVRTNEESATGVLSRFAGSVRQGDLSEQAGDVPGHRSHGRDGAPRNDHEHSWRACPFAIAGCALLRLDGAQNASALHQAFGAGVP